MKTDGENGSTGVPSIARMVDEGLLIALSAVRMAVKNAIIVSALREHSDYDPERYARTARKELSLLARQNEEYARRVGRLRDELTRATGTRRLTEAQRGDVSQFALRGQVHARLTVALDGVADDEDLVVRIVEHAQQAASDEFREAVSTRLLTLAIDQWEPEYAERRNDRIEMLVLINLALLKTAKAEASGAFNDY